MTMKKRGVMRGVLREGPTDRLARGGTAGVATAVTGTGMTGIEARTERGGASVVTRRARHPSRLCKGCARRNAL